MAETYNIPTSSMSKIQRWMNAKRASGQVIQPWELESMATGEMNALQGQRTAQQGLSLQAARDAETRRMNDINTQIKQDEIAAGEKGAQLGLVGNVGTTLAMYNLLKKNPTNTGVNAGGAGARTAQEIAAENAGTTVPNLSNFQPGRSTMSNVTTSEVYPPEGPATPYEDIPTNYQGATPPESVPPYSETTPAVTTTGQAVGQGIDLGGGALAADSGAAGIGSTEAAISGVELGSGATAGTGGVSVGSVMPVVAAVGAADWLRQNSGQLERDYDDRSPWGKATSTPATGVPAALTKAMGMNESNYIAKPLNRIGRMEEKLVGRPLDEAFAGDIEPSLRHFGEAVLDTPRDAYNATIGALTGKDTWLCTQIALHVGITESGQKNLKALRKHCLKYHREWLKAYLVKGKVLVEEINKVVDRQPFYKGLKESMVAPIIEMVTLGKMEDAFEKYRSDTQALIRKYAPQLKENEEV